MKIAIVTLRFDAPGGVEANVAELSKRMRAGGDAVTIYASDLYSESPWEHRSGWAPTVNDVPVRRFPVTRRLIPGLTMPMMTGLIDALAEDRPEVLHVHSHRYGHVLECSAVARALRIPMVVSLHYHPADPGEPLHKALLLRLQDHLFGLTAYRAAASLVVETELERRSVAEFAPGGRIDLIPPGIDAAAWLAPPGAPLPDGLPERYLLYAGRIARNKGLERLFDALRAISPERRPATVLMGQDWGQRAQLEAQARRLGLSSSLTWLGHVADPATFRAVMHGAQLFVLPSEYEAFGIVLLEAMASGVPVIGSAVGGIPEAVDGGRMGRLVPRGDPPALARAIEELWVRDAALESRIVQARRWAARFDWAETARAHRALFGRLVGGSVG